MAQDIITLTLCDVCLEHDDERHDAKPYTIPLPDGGLADIDLCDPHAKPLQDALAELATYARPQKHGRVTARKRGGDVMCPLCGKGLKDQPGLVRHVTRSHPDATPEERARATGGAVPSVTGEYACPECDRTFGSNQAVATHRSRSHGVAGRRQGGDAGQLPLAPS